MRHSRITWFGAAALLFLSADPRGAAQQTCPSPQSPRQIGSLARGLPCPTSRVSFNPNTPNQLLYISRPGDPPRTLHRCGQHYHLPVENLQRNGEITPRNQWLQPGVTPPLAKVGAIVEIHTAYAENVPNPCDDLEGTSCCGGQALVLAWNARVTAGGSGLIPPRPPTFRDLDEWSGSTTGQDKPEEQGCKSPAQWSFALGDFTVGQSQLSVRFPKQGAQVARPLQAPNRLSCDLTSIRPR